MRELIERGIATLPSDKGKLLRRHYLEGERLDHIARALGVSPSKVSRMHASALESLSKLVGGKSTALGRV